MVSACDLAVELRCEDKRWQEVQGEYYCTLCNKHLQLGMFVNRPGGVGVRCCHFFLAAARNVSEVGAEL